MSEDWKKQAKTAHQISEDLRREQMYKTISERRRLASIKWVPLEVPEKLEAENKELKATIQNARKLLEEFDLIDFSSLDIGTQIVTGNYISNTRMVLCVEQAKQEKTDQ